MNKGTTYLLTYLLTYVLIEAHFILMMRNCMILLINVGYSYFDHVSTLLIQEWTLRINVNRNML